MGFAVFMGATVACSLSGPVSARDAGTGDAQGAPSDDPVAHWSLLPQPTGESYAMGRGIGGDQYIVGHNGTVLRSRDHGQSWEGIGPGQTAASLDYPHLRAIAGTAKDDVWVGGFSGPTAAAILFHSGDGGSTWQSWDSHTLGLEPAAVSVPFEVSALWVIDRNVVLAGGAGMLARTEDGGAHWTSLQLSSLPGLAGLYLVDLWGSSPTDIYAVGGITRVAKDQGTTTSVEAGTALDGGDDDGGGSEDGSQDGGSGDGAMTTDAAPGGTSSNGGTSASDNFESSGVVLHSGDGGLTWQVLVPATPCQLWHVNGTPNGAKVIASGACGSLAISKDHGASWTVRGVPLSWKSAHFTDTQITASWVSPSGRAFLAQKYAIYRDIDIEPWDLSGAYDESAAGEEDLPGRVSMGNGFTTTGYTEVVSLWGTSDTDVWAAGPYGVVWHRQ